MSDSYKETDLVRAELAEAFARRLRPADVALPGGCPGDERDGARRWLEGRRWQDVLGDELRREHRDLVHFLTPAGWLYFFPALASLALDLDNIIELDDALMTKLALFPQEVAPLLSDEERRAVVRWLEHMARQYDERGWENPAREALETHWALEPEN